MTGLTGIEVVFLLLFIAVVIILPLIVITYGQQADFKDYDEYYSFAKRERDAAYKLLLDYLDEMEDNMFYRDGEYQIGSSSISQGGDTEGREVRTIKSNELFTVDFSSALIALKNGKRIRRATWNVSMLLYGDEQIHVVRENGDCIEVVAAFCIFDLPFRLEDILAEDWQIID